MSSFTFPNPYPTVFSDFVPKTRIVTDVTNALRAVVTTSEDHGYRNGWEVTLIVTAAYGMEIEAITRQITVLTDDTFQFDLDTRALQSFVIPPSLPAFTTAQCVPVSGTSLNIKR